MSDELIKNNNSKINNKQSKQYVSENIKFKIQKRIGYIFSAFIVSILIVNTINEIYLFGEILLNIAIFYKFVLFIEAIIFFWSTKPGKVKIKRILQISFIFLNGILTLFSDVNQVYVGLSFLIFGSLLVLQYDFFENHRYINYIIFLLLVFVAGVFIYNYYFQEAPSTKGFVEEIDDPVKLHTYKITMIVLRLIFIVIFLILFPSIYIDQINFYKHMNELILNEKESLATFANVGMMLNSTVHNFNNKIVTFISAEYILSNTLKKYEEVIEPSDFNKLINTCNMIRNSSDDMTNIIKDLRNLIKDKTNYQLQTYEINKILENIIKQFTMAYEKNRVKINLIKNDDAIFVKGNSIQFIQIIENLIKNSIEASANPVIEITTGKDPQPYIIIKDNGHGISFCFNCSSHNCLNCKEFQIGRTTKPDGSGTGMVYVQKTLKEMNAKMNIVSKENEGTEITITLPESATKKLEQMEITYLDKDINKLQEST